MFELYTAQTPNGVKIPIALEELGLEYRLLHVDLQAGEQRAPRFLALNRNGRIPVLMTHDAAGRSVTIAESGAILLHLAESTGALLPLPGAARCSALEWLFLQASSIGPVFGAMRAMADERASPRTLARFRAEALRLMALVETRLSEAPWLAGDTYSIADIACFGWLRAGDYSGIDVGGYPHTLRWLDRIDSRQAVQRALRALAAATAAGGAG